MFKLQKVKLLIGEIYSDEKISALAESELRNKYGEIEFKSEIIDFNFTSYYEKETGTGLKRKWISFKDMIEPGAIAEIKNNTNLIEEKFSQNGNRKINLDPGYITGSSLILASTKNYSHRIYLKDGIYAEVTLLFEHKNWVTLKWTYPDYRTKQALDFFSKVRSISPFGKGGGAPAVAGRGIQTHV